jgi:hypothetical protein
MVALGSDDRSISIWLNVQKAPLLVVKEVFDGTIFDLSWSVSILQDRHSTRQVAKSHSPSFRQDGPR